MMAPCVRPVIGALTGMARSQAGPSTLRAAAAFSTTSASSAVGPKKKGAPSASPKKKIALRKNTPAGGSAKQKKRGGAGAAGDLFKSSSYAQTAPSMSFLQEFLPEHATEENVYKVMAWPRRTLEATRYQAFGLTKTIARQFADEPRPKTLVRPHTLQLLDQLDKAQSGSTGLQTLIDAPVGFGVSTLLLQAFSYALESGWFVLYLPRSLSLVDSSSPYVYSEAHRTYLQPELTRGLLERILAFNTENLDKLTLRGGPLTLEQNGKKLEQGSKLSDLIREAIRPKSSPAALHVAFEALMREVVQQKDVPVLIALDGVQGLFSTSHYRDPDYRLLESYELSVPRTLLSALRKTVSGSFGGVQKGAVLAAMSLANKTWPSPPELRSALKLKPYVDPYAKINTTMQTIASECQFTLNDLSQSVLSRREAGALFDTARSEGGLWTPANDEMLMAKLVESGGNLAVFKRSLQNTML